jgi:hypothetical protein
MKELLFEASEELKRAEHLMYVSLKYTRTVDVIKSLILRLIASFDLLIESLLQEKEKENAIFEIPTSPFAKVDLLQNLYKDNKEMLHYLEFYSILRKVARAEHNASKEYRRNLTLCANVDGKDIEITIDIAQDYYHKTVDFFRYVKEHHLIDRT